MAARVSGVAGPEAFCSSENGAGPFDRTDGYDRPKPNPSTASGRWAKSGAAVGRWIALRDAHARRVKKWAVGRKWKTVVWATRFNQSFSSVFYFSRSCF